MKAPPAAPVGPGGPGDPGDPFSRAEPLGTVARLETAAPPAPTARRRWLRGGLQTGALLAGGAVAGVGGFALHQWLTGSQGADGTDSGAGPGADKRADTGAGTGASTGTPAPQALWTTPFTDLDGRPVSLSAFKGQPLVVNFWASWCAPCLEEMPDFQRASLTAEGKRIQFVGIGIDYAKNMKPFAVKLGISYLLLEGGAHALDLVKVAGNSSGALPFTLILDRTGAITLRKLGKMTYAELMAAVTLL